MRETRPTAYAVRAGCDTEHDQRHLNDCSRWSRYLFAGLGCLNLTLGLVGAIVPLMPTTVFLLVALWCFTRSSPRTALWLNRHPRFGPALRQWRDERVIPLEAKYAAIVSMSAGLALVHALYPEMVAIKWLATGICLLVLVFLLSRPHAPRAFKAAVAAD